MTESSLPRFFRSRLHRVRLVRLLALALLLVLVLGPRSKSQVRTVAAKAQFLALKSMGALALNQPLAGNLALTDPDLLRFVANRELEFVSAVRLGYGESEAWRNQGCAHFNCALVTFYNHSESGTLEAVFDVTNRDVVDQWLNPSARPGATQFVAQRAKAIAAADPSVQAVLGNLNQAPEAMIPMTAWLQDDSCLQDWCVDLTYHAPDGSGRIFHIFVNMEEDTVARTFYSRARAERVYAPPLDQILAQQDGALFNNGCHDAYGWNVCWEMTAHDGVNFRDANYEGLEIFSSAKIGQVEVWYPSWPGGYRDEIGFQASVPPKFGTEVVDLGDGFEVRQLFTEPFDWPNCICCYRYTQILRFNQDGSFEPRFVSHGPGCDDPSEYRPFWRLDIDLDGAPDDEAWLWDGAGWTEATTETQFDLFAGTSPLGEKLAIAQDERSYRWRPTRNDPFGADEAPTFLLRFNLGEGDDPILTGPANTFQPPGQWVDGEALSEGNIVVWYVPLLKTKKGGPWWCMPDPAPDFSPCEAIVQVVPAGRPEQPTQEEIEQAPPTPTVGPTVTPAPTSTPEGIGGETAVDLLQNAGCTSCHQIGDMGEAHKVGPDLSGIGVVAAGRVEGLSAEAYLLQSLVEPNAFIVPDCPNGPCLANIMPRDYSQRLSDAQLQLLVDHLLTLRDVPAATATPSLPAAVGDTASASTSAPAPRAPDAAQNVGVTANWLPLLVMLGALVLILVALGLLVSARR